MTVSGTVVTDETGNITAARISDVLRQPVQCEFQTNTNNTTVTVSCEIARAVNHSGSISESIVTSLMTMMDGVQPLWLRPPSVMRVPGATPIVGMARCSMQCNLVYR
jgi:hypothetical protein